MALRVSVLALALLAACSGEAAPDPCASLPVCTTPATSAEAYGQPCTIALGNGWHGRPVCCTGDIVAASCITRALGGQACDPDQPISCTYPLTCGTDPSCSGPCCVPGGS